MAKVEMKKKQAVKPVKKKAAPQKRTEVDVLAEINALRAQKNLRPLTVNKALEAAAIARAKYIHDNDDFSHRTKKGGHYKDFVTNATDYSFVGENLARYFKDKKKMVKAWADSKTHNANIMMGFDETGIGTYGDVTVQFFGRKNGKNGNP